MIVQIPREKKKLEEEKNELWDLKKQLREEQELCKREKESWQEQEQQEVQHAHINETTPIQVIDSFEQLADNKQGEKLQENDFSQEIEQMLE